MKIQKSVSILFAVSILVLSSCAGKKLKPEQIQEVRAISVLSLVPEKIQVHNVGTTIFQNEEGGVDFAFSKHFTSHTKSTLSSISVAPFAYDKPSFEAWKKKRTSGVGGFLSMANEMDFTKEYFLPLAEKAGIRYLVVFSPIRHDNYSLYPGGFGVFCRSAFGITGTAASYALYSGHLWDVAQKKSIYFEYFTPNTTQKAGKWNCDDLAKMKEKELMQNFSNTLLETQEGTVKEFWQKSGLINNQ